MCRAIAVILSLTISSTFANEPRALRIMDIPLEEKEILIDMHNRLREEVARGDTNHPKASNMRKLVWNSYLEKASVDWAATCAARHRPRIGQSEDSLCGLNLFPQVAENLYIVTLREYDDPDPDEWLPYAVTKWANESQHFTYPGTCAPGKMCGHYTQMIWADTGYVGCGVVECSGVEGFRADARSVVVVCSYGAGGNLYLGGSPLPPYKVGRPCSACSRANNHCQSGLCTGQRKLRCKDKNMRKCDAYKRMVPDFCDQCSAFNYQSFTECRRSCGFCAFQSEHAKGADTPAY